MLTRKFIKGRVCRENFTPAQETKLRRIFDYQKKWFSGSFEEFELDFMREKNLAQSIKGWQTICKLHKKYCKANPEVDPEQVFDALNSLRIYFRPDVCPRRLPRSLWKDITAVYGEHTRNSEKK